jgi:hypothetical protein
MGAANNRVSQKAPGSVWWHGSSVVMYMGLTQTLDVYKSGNFYEIACRSTF